MDKYIEIYERALSHVDDVKGYIMSSIVLAIKSISVKPLELGNGKYFYVEEDGVEVPAYWDEYLNNWKPIYDRHNTGAFGWSDFSECCRIFEAIRRKLFNKIR